MDVQEKISQIEEYLKQQEKKINGATTTTTTTTTTQPAENEILILLKKISENQEIDRKRYERNNPVEGDEPIYDWAEETINPGQMVQFSFIVPEGQVFFFEEFSITYNANTIYYIWLDEVYQPTLTDTLQDFGDHAQIYKPPKFCYNKAEIWALNNGIVAQTYSVFFRGFNRWYRNINREIEYESLIKKQEQIT